MTSVLFDAAGVGYSGSAPNTVPFSQPWAHTSSGTAPGVAVWIAAYKASTDILTGSSRSCSYGGQAMLSLGVIPLLGNSIFLECFVLKGQPLGPQTVLYSFDTTTGKIPDIIRGDSESYTNVGTFGALQMLTGTAANAALAAISAAGEVLSAGYVARNANINAVTGLSRWVKNNVTPRFAIGEDAGAATVSVGMTNGATDWAIGAVRVAPGVATNDLAVPIPVTTAMTISADAPVDMEVDTPVSVQMTLSASTDTPPPPPPTVTGATLGALWSPPRGIFPAADIVVTPMSSTAPAYSSPKTFNWSTDAARFRIGGALIDSLHNNFDCGVNAASGQSTDTNPLTSGLTSFETEFWTVGPDCAVIFRNFTNSDYLVLADDMPITSNWQNFTSGAGYKYLPLHFNDGFSHRIRVLHGCNGFVGVLVPGSGDIQPAAPRRRLGATGDSYLQGAGTASEPGPVMAGGICGQIALRAGLEVINLGQGTTGYQSDGVAGNRSHYGSPQRLACLNAFAYDAIMVFGGGNDSSADAPTVANQYAIPFWRSIKAAHPNATLIVVGVQAPNLFPAAGMTALNTALRTAALASPDVDVWVDMREPEMWVTDATKSLFITSEFPASIHPGKAGADNLVSRLLTALAPVPFLGGDARGGF